MRSLARSTSFSITAPQWTAEDEAQDERCVTEEERAEIRADVMAPLCPSSVIADEQHSRIAYVQQEMLFLLSSLPDKEAYLQAVRQAPHVLRDEANYALFLRHANYDAETAAKDAIRYWHFRKALFGDRFCLPVLSSTEGALNDEDWQLLRSGPWTMLGPTDRHGRTVLYEVASAFRADRHTLTSLTRCLFYAATLALQRPSTLLHGVVVLSNRKYFDPSHFTRKSFRQLVKMLNSSFLPIRVKAIHYCVASDRSSMHWLLPIMKAMMTPYLHRRVLLHVARSDEVLREELSRFGLTSLPSNLVAEKAKRDQTDTAITVTV